MKPKHRTDSQIAAFKALAQEVDCDVSETAFDAKLNKVARTSVPRKPVKRAPAAKVVSAKREQIASKTEAPAPARKKIRIALPDA